MPRTMTRPPDELFVARIKRDRSNLGLAPEAFATLIGVSMETLRNWENGRGAPEHEALKRLAALFGWEHEFVTDELRQEMLDRLEAIRSLGGVMRRYLGAFA